MDPVDNRLLVHRLRAVLLAAEEEGAPTEEHWYRAAELLTATAWEDPRLRDALHERDLDEVRRRVGEWDSGAQPYPPHDRAVLKRALKAFRKRLKLQKLDDESRIGGGPFSKGRASSVVAIQPPSQYPAEVWEELTHQGRLRHTGQGFFELVEG